MNTVQHWCYTTSFFSNYFSPWISVKNVFLSPLLVDYNQWLLMNHPIAWSSHCGRTNLSPQTVWWSLIFTKGFLLVSERVFSISVYSKTVERPNFSIKHRPPSTFIKENNLILVGLCYPSVDDGCLINNIYHAVQLTLLLSRELQIKAADRPCVLASVCQRFGRRVLKDSFFFL